MRLAPLVMTLKFTTSKMRKTTAPTTRLPPTAKRPKVSIRWPAAPGPSEPLSRMSRVVATLRPRRKSVVISSSEGKTEKSIGLIKDSATSSTSTASETLNAKSTSSAAAGSGSTMMASTPSTAMGSSRSPRACAGTPPVCACSLKRQLQRRGSCR